MEWNVDSISLKNKIMKQTPIKILIAITICIVMPLMVQAQPAEPNDAAGVPIDGGLGLLLELVAGLRGLLGGFFLTEALLMAGDAGEVVGGFISSHADVAGLLGLRGDGLLTALGGLFGDLSQGFLHGGIFGQFLFQFG